jgi:hypothetical protein
MWRLRGAQSMMLLPRSTSLGINNRSMAEQAEAELLL